MSELLYKPLFEVNLLHDYYLISSDGGSFFEKTKAEKEALIKTKLSQQTYNVTDFFGIEPTEATKKILSEYKLIYKKTTLGFLVGIEVMEELKLGAKVYKPRFELPDNLSLTFSINVVVTNFLSMTNISMRPTLPTIYYFTNKDKIEFVEAESSYKTLPISVEAEPYQNGIRYEMGALVKFGAGLREALEFTMTSSSNLSFWGKLNDKRYVTNADRVLLPAIFNYPVKKEQNITQLQVVLEDQDGNLIKSITKSSISPLQNVHLNFEFIDETIENPVAISEGFYNLKIKENGGSEISYSVYLNESLYVKNQLGIIDVRLDVTDSPFSLLDVDGYIKTRVENTGEYTSHPVYELRFKNRKTYWRYNKDPKFQAEDVSVDLNPHVVFEPVTKKIISKKPKGLTRALVPFISGANEKILPYPKTPSLKVEGRRMFSEIYINKSNRLVDS
ncbi:hypothetical protein KO493_05875 [Tamlana agarivorans]|uniref:Uncharacterized protein n=1 Tax=Pseudotamlana agarivorans TaxID=481183 RepID=A0ACC5U7B6_9FLAO|nr:hypothetical protein [Tamlana agarivorans]MBU2950217.1 hypothetical protein [Tamlana agarivorans]